MKKLMALILALAMALTMVACGSKDTNTGKDSETKTLKVGVVQLVQHEALDAATKGFTDALKDALGDKVEVEVKNASGDANTCGTIVNGFVSENVDRPHCRPLPPPPAPFPSWAPLSPITPPLWRSLTGTAPWAATSPAPPTWLLWTSRLPCSRSCSPMPRR